MSTETSAASATDKEALDAFEQLHEIVHVTTSGELEEQVAIEVLRATVAYVTAVFNAAGLASGRVSRRRPVLLEVRTLLKSLGVSADGVTAATRLHTTPEEVAQELAERTIAGHERGEWGPWFLDATIEALLDLEQIDTPRNTEAAREHLRSAGWCSREYVGYSEHPEHSTVVVWHHPDLPNTPPVHTDVDEDCAKAAELAAEMSRTSQAWGDVPKRSGVPTPAEDQARRELYVSCKYAFLTARERWLYLAFHRGDPGLLVAPVWGVSEAFPGGELKAEVAA